MLKGLKGMAAAARLAAEVRKASGSGLRQVAIASPEAETHEQLHFALDLVKFDPEVMLDHPKMRMAVAEARSRGLVSGTDDARAIGEVITRIANGEHDSIKMDAATGRTLLAHFLQNGVHDEGGLATLEQLAHEDLKDTIGKAGKGRSSDAGADGPAGEEPGPPDDHRAQRGRPGGDGGVRPHDGGARGEEGPEPPSRMNRSQSGD
jgi:hypothetical protein